MHWDRSIKKDKLRVLGNYFFLLPRKKFINYSAPQNTVCYKKQKRNIAKLLQNVLIWVARRTEEESVMFVDKGYIQYVYETWVMSQEAFLIQKKYWNAFVSKTGLASHTSFGLLKCSKVATDTKTSCLQREKTIKTVRHTT